MIDKTFEEIMEMMNNLDYYFTFTYRDVEGFNEENYLEICMSSFSPSYFIWFQLDPKYIDYYLNKYKIKE